MPFFQKVQITRNDPTILDDGGSASIENRRKPVLRWAKGCGYTAFLGHSGTSVASIFNFKVGITVW